MGGYSTSYLYGSYQRIPMNKGGISPAGVGRREKSDSRALLVEGEVLVVQSEAGQQSKRR